MIAGIIVGLVIGVALGVVVGLLLRADHVGAARTAQARLADASAANDALQADLSSARSDAVRATATARRASGGCCEAELGPRARAEGGGRADRRVWSRPASS